MPLPDLKCPFCSKVSTRGTGLASHIRGSHSAEYASWAAARKPGAGVVRAAAVPSGPAASGLGAIIALLKQQGEAIDGALVALRGVGAPVTTPASARAKSTEKVGGGKRQLSPEGRARLIEALKRRWAKQKAGARAA